MDLQNIVIYAIIALVVMFVLPKLGIGGRRRGGNSPLNPPGDNPGNTPGNRPGSGGGGGGIFPDIGGGREEPKAPTNSPDTEGDFADRVEGDRPSKST